MNKTNKLRLLCAAVISMCSLSSFASEYEEVIIEETNTGGWIAALNIDGVFYPESATNFSFTSVKTTPATGTVGATKVEKHLKEEIVVLRGFGYGVSASVGRSYYNNSLMLQVGYQSLYKKLQDKELKKDLLDKSVIYFTANGFLNLDAFSAYILPYIGGGIGMGQYRLDLTGMDKDFAGKRVTNAETTETYSMFQENIKAWSVVAQLLAGVNVPVSETTSISIGYKMLTPLGDVEFKADSKDDKKGFTILKGTISHAVSLGVNASF